jgi:hypothetical protein
LPTYRNSARAFTRLYSETRSGDLVYTMHYSGHGARVRIAYENIKEPNAIDKALVPVDIKVVASTDMDQAKYVHGVEIARWLKDLVGKGLGVTIILDSYHAGGSTRHKGSAAARGTGFVDYSLLRTDLCVNYHRSRGPVPPASLRRPSLQGLAVGGIWVHFPCRLHRFSEGIRAHLRREATWSFDMQRF